MTREIHIPDIGDVEEVQVIELCVVPGDTVGPEDALIVIESDKASMEVPAGVSGVIEALTVAVGDDVAEGQIIARINVSADAEDVESRQPQMAETNAAESTPGGDEGETATLPPTGAGQSAGGSTRVEVCVPDIGEAQDVAVIEVSVSAGDRVKVDDLLVVVESDKASMEIPAGQDGRVLEVHVTEGSEVTEGTLLVTMEVSVDRAPQADVEVPVVADERELLPVQKQPELPAPPLAGSGSETESDQGSLVYAGPAVRRLARELGVDLAEVRGTGTRSRIV
ncbi:MAG: E3 binding domain-containing protein, partial [Gammaproteobacteria bacterium]|nr:E3 binding domain-containing protein [Gammaproteobacteria bacterium]